MLSDARKICLGAIASCLPEQGVKKALSGKSFAGDVYLVAAGKAAFAMAKAASETVKIKKGIMISKYGHLLGELEDIEGFEAGHPLPDGNTIKASERVLELCRDLKSTDTVLFLLSGGASSLFELPLVSLEELKDINDQMLKKGLDIIEINAIRKRISKIKGGRFAKHCEPARVYSIILSDVLSDRVDVIGSGPSVRDDSTARQALEIIDRYDLKISEATLKLIAESESVDPCNSEHVIIGSVKMLCRKAEEIAAELGYQTEVIADDLSMDVEDAAGLLAKKIDEHVSPKHKTALIATGENTVKVTGSGLGGRNQQLVLSLTEKIAGKDILVMSLGSDGTDGPTDAAGAYVDGGSLERFRKEGIDVGRALADNDSYHALKAIDGLIFTGPTGTNVNDVCVVLIDNEQQDWA